VKKPHDGERIRRRSELAGTAVDEAPPIRERLADAHGDVERLRAELRAAIDARDALVFEAIDLHHVSQGEAARIMGITPQSVVRILANGPPPDEMPSAHPELP
jgi:DNA-directed RNA polymerase specialized sigma24 family protein